MTCAAKARPALEEYAPLCANPLQMIVTLSPNTIRSLGHVRAVVTAFEIPLPAPSTEPTPAGRCVPNHQFRDNLVDLFPDQLQCVAQLALELK